MQTIDTPNTSTNPPATSTLPDGDTLANEMIASAGKRDTAALLRKASKGATAAKTRLAKGEPPRVMFQPRGWSFSGGID